MARKLPRELLGGITGELAVKPANQIPIGVVWLIKS